VRVGICDTGLRQDYDPARHQWLAGVDGEPDPLGPVLPGGAHSIPQYSGHGTFAAGVARCMAPGATVYVSNHFTKSGGELEYVIIEKLEQLIRDQAPQVVNLSAGTYTRHNWIPLAFGEFRRRNPDITLVAAAGNDATDRKFWPAAFPWAVGVGALGTDQQHRAWFSNYGDWVDVYALGEGLVNAYASGVYTYQEPPKRPARQTFDGMARWDGTSFSAPLVAGLIAAEMARSGNSASAAAQALLTKAQGQRIDGVGPALFPCDAG
jgi:subtilisin family serine protease